MLTKRLSGSTVNEVCISTLGIVFVFESIWSSGVPSYLFNDTITRKQTAHECESEIQHAGCTPFIYSPQRMGFLLNDTGLLVSSVPSMEALRLHTTDVINSVNNHCEQTETPTTKNEMSFKLFLFTVFTPSNHQ
ncbi:uncharacterized protein LOC144075490 isoform X2 [Stigmatopora argus]